MWGRFPGEGVSRTETGARCFSGAMLGPALRDKHAYDFHQRIGPQLTGESTIRECSGSNLRHEHSMAVVEILGIPIANVGSQAACLSRKAGPNMAHNSLLIRRERKLSAPSGLELGGTLTPSAMSDPRARSHPCASACPRATSRRFRGIGGGRECRP